MSSHIYKISIMRTKDSARRGVGRQISQELFNKLPARWEAAVLETNQPTQQFWRKAFGSYRQGIFQETALNNDEWQGPVFSLDNRK